MCLEPAFRPVVPCIYTTWFLLASPLALPTIYTLMDPRHWGPGQTPPNLQKKSPLFFFFLFSPITVIGSTIYLVSQHQGDGEFEGGGGGPKISPWFPLSITSHIQFNSGSSSARILPVSLVIYLLSLSCSASSCSSNIPNSVLPQGLCTYLALFLECSSSEWPCYFQSSV